MKLFIISRSLLLALALGLQIFLIVHVKKTIVRNTALKANTESTITQGFDKNKKVSKEILNNDQTAMAAVQRADF